MQDNKFLLAAVGFVLSLPGALPGQMMQRELPTINQLQVLSRPAFLGVGIVDVDADRVTRLKLTDERGVEVTTVEEGSPADTAGIKTGDVLLTYNGEIILGSQQFVRLVRETPVGRKVRVSLWRNGKEQPVVVTTASPKPIVRALDVNGRGDFLLGMPPDFPTIMPDVPKVIVAWNNSMLGIEGEPVDAQLAQYFGVKQGVLVRSVHKDTPGEKAGFKAGDVLTSVDGQTVRSPDDLRRMLRGSAKPIAVAVMRDHKTMTLNVAAASERDE